MAVSICFAVRTRTERFSAGGGGKGRVGKEVRPDGGAGATRTDDSGAV